jgi:uncharacterized protein (DUF1015 family)
MASIHPFRGVRPADELAWAVIAPPYDVLSEAEARAITAEKPRSFIRVTRSEVDLPEGSDSHGKEAYGKARENLEAFLSEGSLVQDGTPCLYLYSQTWRGRTQRGLMALCSTKEYDEGLIKKHELTRPDKEQDRTDHVQTLGAQTGLVFLTYRDGNESIRSAMEAAASLEPAWSVDTGDGVLHSLSVIGDDALIAALQEAFSEADALYIADGHHRSAAASRVAKLRSHSGTSGLFLAGIFPDSELQVLAYNRLVQDLNGYRPEVFLAKLSESFHIRPGVDPVPVERGRWTMYLGGRWFGLEAKDGVVPDDVVGSLDVSVLQDRVLSPVLGIANPRTDTRIRFVGGIRGHSALSQAVDNGEAMVAFHLHPTGIDQLLAVADADKLMPPKSTWFEPKLRGGVLVHRIED